MELIAAEDIKKGDKLMVSTLGQVFKAGHKFPTDFQECGGTVHVPIEKADK